MLDRPGVVSRIKGGPVANMGCPKIGTLPLLNLLTAAPVRRPAVAQRLKAVQRAASRNHIIRRQRPPDPLQLELTDRPNVASQIRTAFSSIAANTGSRSPGEVLITCKTSDVAVCCRSASVS